MVATLICPTSCGFVWVAALEIVRETTKTLRRENREGTAKFRARSMQECYKRFNKVFEDRSEQFAVVFSNFRRKYQLSENCLAAGIRERRTRSKSILKNSVFKTGRKCHLRYKLNIPLQTAKDAIIAILKFRHYFRWRWTSLWGWQKRIHFSWLAKRRRSSHARQEKPKKLHGLCITK